jgi:adenylate cyclase
MSVPDEVDATFLIADLAGYTALTAVHGDAHAARAVGRYTEIVQAVLPPTARLVERVGDEVLVVATEPAAAVQTALALRAAVEREPLFPTVRSGVHAGTAVRQGTSYFGSALNLTARVAAHARAGQILCTESVRALAGAADGVAYQSLGAVRFKNILDPVTVFEVLAGAPRGTAIVLDPVCRMQVQPDTAPAHLPFAGRTFYFCSFDCARAFTERPDHYAGAVSSA